MSDWALVYESYDPAQERLREALCTLGNGYFTTRGAAPEAVAGEVHYPGTYLAGGYNRLRSEVAGQAVENEDLVNLPNWLPLTFRIDGGAWFDLEQVQILDYHQSLDLHRAVLERSVRFADAEQRISRLSQRRLVHMGMPHLAALATTLVAENWSGSVEFRSALDGRVVNDGVARYRGLGNRHLEPLRVEEHDSETLFLKMRTTQSRREIALAARTRLYLNGEHLALQPGCERRPDYIAHRFRLAMTQGDTLRLEKCASLYSSRDRAITECGTDALTTLRRAGTFEELLASHSEQWAQLWRRFDIGIGESDGEQGERHALILRLHILHMLQTASPNSMDLDAGVPARGWHGEAYRGHIFWDELFIFPLLNLRLPEITRALLMYRYRRLDAARANADQANFRGAMYPWQSGSNGREENQCMHFNPKSGRWIPDYTHLQRHVNAAIAYNIWQYYEVSGDMEFLSFYGAEMFLEIARFWGSIARFNDELGRYEIHGVIGPDEFQTANPGSDSPGLDNHSYTNIMAVWVLCRALELLKLLPEERCEELRSMLALGDAELALWEDISRRMRVVFHDDGIISQFEGYGELEEFDWEGYRQKYGDIHRLDRILEAEGDTTNRYKASKQADVLMLFYLFSSEELGEIFERLGYPFEYETIPRNIDYYAQRTAHGSTLSRIVHSWVQVRSDRAGSWRLFQEALESDIADIQGGTTAEGIHLGAMAGTVDLLQRGYTGIVTRGEVLWLNPSLPDEIRNLTMSIRYRGQTLDLDIRQDFLRIRARASNAAPIKLSVRDGLYELKAGDAREFPL
ncbi:MAG TPA: glycosyl hydrolase family 65 protein [Gammaproteobacteria bacterium]